MEFIHFIIHICVMSKCLLWKKRTISSLVTHHFQHPNFNTSRGWIRQTDRKHLCEWAQPLTDLAGWFWVQWCLHFVYRCVTDRCRGCWGAQQQVSSCGREAAGEADVRFQLEGCRSVPAVSPGGAASPGRRRSTASSLSSSWSPPQQEAHPVRGEGTVK